MEFRHGEEEEFTECVTNFLNILFNVIVPPLESQPRQGPDTAHSVEVGIKAHLEGQQELDSFGWRLKQP